MKTLKDVNKEKNVFRSNQKALYEKIDQNTSNCKRSKLKLIHI